MQRILQILIIIIILIVVILMCSVLYGFYHKKTDFSDVEKKVSSSSVQRGAAQVDNSIQLKIKKNKENNSTDEMVNLTAEQAIKECIISAEMRLAAVRYRISKNGQITMQEVATAAEERAHELIGRPDFYIEKNVEFYARNYASLFASDVPVDGLPVVENSTRKDVQNCEFQARPGFTMTPIYNWAVLGQQKNLINIVKIQ
ncbi:hypothetical protein [Aquitalea sp.]|uniref:hypothetical protein n=1 Tax=Aquitalea sp. TaxID=1872623 RepID=UPI00258E880D|nr:hypothetical protein [Aquitalea sp.]